MAYEQDLARGLNVIDPVRGDDCAWAEGQLSEIMQEHDLSRDEALDLAKKHAPTIYRWLQSDGLRARP
jgi:hypothetical protein